METSSTSSGIKSNSDVNLNEHTRDVGLVYIFKKDLGSDTNLEYFFKFSVNWRLYQTLIQPLPLKNM